MMHKNNTNPNKMYAVNKINSHDYLLYATDLNTIMYLQSLNCIWVALE